MLLLNKLTGPNVGHVQLASISDFTCNFCRVCSFAVDTQESFLDFLRAKLLPVNFFLLSSGRDGPLQFPVNFLWSLAGMVQQPDENVEASESLRRCSSATVYSTLQL
jgi:hypothetical protein